ncbi:adenosylcobalamin-dependent ribonucleoside-diphosphate reductase [Desulfarculus baarsii]
MNGEVSPFAPEAAELLRRRYLAVGPDGRHESPERMLWRVARAVAAAEERWDGAASAAAMAGRFFELMAGGLFLPNSPTLINAGRRLGQLSACFVLPVEDSLESIFEALKQAALIHKSGGGTGFDFSRLRPRGDDVASTRGVSSGPLSFMHVFDVATEAVRQGGVRRGANMASLAAWHPDILEFVTAKQTPGRLENFNLSLWADDAFMDAAAQGRGWALRNPRHGRTVATLEAAELLEVVARAAHASGEPGMLFGGAINRANPTPALGAIEAVNPCGEQPLLPYESCVLGSLALPRFVRGGDMDWPALEEAAALATRFLDDVLEINRQPLPQVAEASLRTRKIGLGLLGLADALIMLGLAYDSQPARDLAGRVMARVTAAAREQSAALARRRGDFPAFANSAPRAAGAKNMRNATVSTIAPTGALSLLLGWSSGIEPLFALHYHRHMQDGQVLELTCRPFLQRLRALGLDSPANLAALRAQGRASAVQGLPAAEARLFATAHQIAPHDHLAMQAACQRHVDNGVSKTINLPSAATVGQVREIFLQAHALNLKGVTVFRHGCRMEQVLRLSPAAEGARVEASGGRETPPSCGFSPASRACGGGCCD